MNEIEALRPKQYDDYLKELDIEMRLLNINDLEKISILITKIDFIRKFISHKIKNREKLSFVEQNIFYKTTEKINHNLLIKSGLFNDSAFRDIYNIYLTDSNFEIETMSKTHSNNVAIREFYGIQLNPSEVIEFLKKIVEDFNAEILENNLLFKENDLLKNAIKREYKSTIKELKKDKTHIENDVFETALFSKMIYLDFLDRNLKNEIVTFDKLSFELEIDFYVHIAFGHYYQILKKSKRYKEKDHFAENDYLRWCEILFDLSCMFNHANLSIENTHKIDFVANNQYYRLTLDKQKKKATSLFPLDEDEIAAIGSSEILVIP
jgi:hypothetical protein